DEAAWLGRVAVNRAPLIAEDAAEIGARPAIGVERLVDGVGRTPAVRQVGRACPICPSHGQHDCAPNKPLHRHSNPTAATASPPPRRPRRSGRRFGYGTPAFSMRFIGSFELKAC